MFNYSSAKLNSLIIHSVGNKMSNDGYQLSSSPVENLSSDVKAILTNYFLSPFRDAECYNFWHPSQIALNDIYSFCNGIWNNKKSFNENSKNIAKHLYECSTHPKIKSGEIYISLFSDCVIDEEIVNAIGIFKSETKETYLKVSKAKENYEILAEEGLNINKIDKASIIFNSGKENGFKVFVIDNLSKSSEAQYWKDDFLKVIACSDSYHFTENYLKLTKNFVTKHLPSEYEIVKAEQVDMLNTVGAYFKEHEVFEENKFMQDVLKDKTVIKSFKNFKENYQYENQIDIIPDFDISSPALKKQARIFKGVIKLDKNFHIYIHGHNNLIEKGYDSKAGKQYYKIYFDKEA